MTTDRQPEALPVPDLVNNLEREAFEKWLPAIRSTNVRMAKRRDGTYQANQTQAAWRAWQARAAMSPTVQQADQNQRRDVRGSLIVNMMKFAGLTKQQAKAIVAFAFVGEECDPALFEPTEKASACLLELIVEARKHLPLAAACWNQEPQYRAHVAGVLSLISRIDAAVDAAMGREGEG